MSPPVGQASLARCLLTWGVVSALVAALADACAGVLLQPTAGPATAEDVLVRAAAVTALLCVPQVWWAVSSTCWRAARGTLPGVPTGLVRRGVLLACGGAVALAGLSPAHAGGPEGRDAPARQVLHGLPLPERASLPAESAVPRGVPSSTRRSLPARPTRPARTGGDDRHVVRAGESLWSIAAAELPPDSADHTVDALWRRIHALNTGVVGPDPGLIHPGQSLRLPDAPREPSGPPARPHHEGERS